LAVSKSFFGFRVYSRGGDFRSPYIVTSIEEGLNEIEECVSEIDRIEEDIPVGQWNWKDDREMALEYYNRITSIGWTEFGGIIFKPEVRK
jgi:hypothetical protein